MISNWWPLIDDWWTRTPYRMRGYAWMETIFCIRKNTQRFGRTFNVLFKPTEEHLETKTNHRDDIKSVTSATDMSGVLWERIQASLYLWHMGWFDTTPFQAQRTSLESCGKGFKLRFLCDTWTDFIHHLSKRRGQVWSLMGKDSSFAFCVTHGLISYNAFPSAKDKSGVLWEGIQASFSVWHIDWFHTSPFQAQRTSLESYGKGSTQASLSVWHLD